MSDLNLYLNSSTQLNYNESIQPDTLVSLAYLMIKQYITDSDADALISKQITSNAGPSGCVINTGASGVSQLQFNILDIDTVVLTPRQTYVMIIKIVLNNGFDFVPVDGQRLVNAVSGGITANVMSSITPNPLQLAFYTLSGCTLDIDFYDAYGNVTPLTDTNGGIYSAIQPVIAPATTVSLALLLTTFKPDSVHFLTGLPTIATAVRLRVITGAAVGYSVYLNQGGLPTGATGTAGNGCNTGYAPTSASPLALNVGDTKIIGENFG